MYLLDRENPVKHSYKIASDVMHIKFIASASSQLQSSVGLFNNIAIQSK